MRNTPFGCLPLRALPEQRRTVYTYSLVGYAHKCGYVRVAGSPGDKRRRQNKQRTRGATTEKAFDIFFSVHAFYVGVSSVFLR